MTTARGALLAVLASGAASLLATPAQAEDREYCPQRPGLGTPACTIAPGRISVETALTDWTLDTSPEERSDVIEAGETIVRIGVSNGIEAQVGFTPFGRSRKRDTATGDIAVVSGVGDVQLGVKANLMNPDGDGLSIAVEPFVTLPTGRHDVGAGDWGAGFVVPVNYDLSDTVNLEVTSEVDAAVNDSGSGRHFAALEVVGVQVAVTQALNAIVEGAVRRDDDPSGKTTHVYASSALAWRVSNHLQLDLGAIAGLNSAASRIELYWGISRRF